MGPQISPCILYKNEGDSIATFVGDGLTINFPCEHAEQGYSLGKRIFWFFNGWPSEFLIIRRIIIDPGCPR